MNSQVKKFLLQKERSICAEHGYKLFDKYLGGGATGRVFLAQPTKNKIRSTEKLKLVQKENEQLEVAIKIVYADVGTEYLESYTKYVPGEISITNKAFGLPNVLLDVFVSHKRIFMVMEFATKGDLKKIFNQHISAKTDGRYMKEKHARRYFQEIAKGVHQLHQNNIAHRDIKLENVLVSKGGKVMIADLGFSFISLKQDKNQESFLGATTASHCGTRCFVAPEVIKGHKIPYNPFKADMWSLGVVLYLLTNGSVPFKGKTTKEVYKNIKKWNDRPLPFRKGLSRDCQNLINRLLKLNAKNRPTAEEVLHDPWFNEQPRDKRDLSLSDLALTQFQRAIAEKAVYKHQAIYVSSYLYQRKKLLQDRRNFLLKKGYKVEDLRDAGIMIRLPQKDTGEAVVHEVWRFEENELRKTITIPNPFVRNHNAQSKAVEYPWAWAPDKVEPTVGIRQVDRVIEDLPLLGKWADLRDSKDLPKNDFEKCIKQFSTVDLDAQKSFSVPQVAPEVHRERPEMSDKQRKRQVADRRALRVYCLKKGLEKAFDEDVSFMKKAPVKTETSPIRQGGLVSEKSRSKERADIKGNQSSKRGSKNRTLTENCLFTPKKIKEESCSGKVLSLKRHKDGKTVETTERNYVEAEKRVEEKKKILDIYEGHPAKSSNRDIDEEHKVSTKICAEKESKFLTTCAQFNRIERILHSKPKISGSRQHEANLLSWDMSTCRHGISQVCQEKDHPKPVERIPSNAASCAKHAVDLLGKRNSQKDGDGNAVASATTGHTLTPYQQLQSTCPHPLVPKPPTVDRIPTDFQRNDPRKAFYKRRSTVKPLSSSSSRSADTQCVPNDRKASKNSVSTSSVLHPVRNPDRFQLNRQATSPSLSISDKVRGFIANSVEEKLYEVMY